MFDQLLEYDPATDLEQWLKQVPAKWAVYLFADAEDRPIQLLCVKNLRASLKRRLGGDELIDGPSKRVNYREIVRRIHWRRVDSAFEADLIYLEAARTIFPQSYQGMVGFRPAWFVHVDPRARFPRYVKTTRLQSTTAAAASASAADDQGAIPPAGGIYFGPVEDKHAAARLIELVEDLFDLCRYYNILVEAPGGRACAYKEMGKCPAPCDGSISMDQYRALVQQSVQTLMEPRQQVREHESRMKAAAAELRFEAAARIRAYIQQLSLLGKGAFRYVRPLRDFVYLAMQRGPWAGTAKVFLVRPGEVRHILSLIHPPRPGEVLRVALEAADGALPDSLDAAGAERIAVVANHLFQAKDTHGVFMPLDAADEPAIAKAYRALMKQKQADEDGEGVLKELQAM